MKVVLLPADEGGCAHYRLKYPMAALQNEPDLDIRVEEGLPIHRTPEFVQRVVGVGDVDADVLVFQRPLHRVVADSIPHFRRKGITCIVDIDDDFTCLHPQHYARHVLEPRRSPDDNWNHLKRACGMADLVTCSTPALAKRHGGRGHAIVIPNYIPRKMLGVPKRDDGNTVGWTGYTMFHPKDLTATRSGVARALEDTGARFLVVGNKADVKEELDLTIEPDQVGPYSLAEYPQGVTQFTVGIVPLLQSKFNDAKSYLKGMEFAACGVSFVASPTPEYQVLHDDWNLGLLAGDRSKDWRRLVKRLLTDTNLRVEMSAHGKAVIAEHFTYEDNAWRWAEVWKDTHDRCRLQHVTRMLNV